MRDNPALFMMETMQCILATAEADMTERTSWYRTLMEIYSLPETSEHESHAV